MARFSIPPSNLSASAITGTAVIEQQLDDHIDATTSVHGIADTSELATKEYADNSASAAVTALIDSAPEALNTLNELSAALNNDANFASTIANSFSEKLDISSASATYLTQTDAATLYETVGSASAVASDLTDHENSTTNVHGIADTSLLATQSYADNSASASQSAAESYADSLSVNYDPAGSASAAQTAAESYADSLAVNYDAAGSASAIANDLTDHENATTNVHGILDTADLATKAYADNSASAAAAALVDSAPSTLDTLNELAAALGDDPNFATTTASALGTKAPLDSPALTGTPTAPTAGSGTNTTQIATTEFVNTEIANDAIAKSIITTKGDIIVATGPGTPARLGVGTNGQVLVANSSAAGGVEWSTAGSSLPSQTGNSGKYLTTDGSNASWGSLNLTGSIPLWTYVGGVPTTATTTAPTLANLTWRTSSFNRQLGDREWELQLTLDKSFGGNAGFGDYLFTLPAGMPDFNTSFASQVLYTGAVNASSSAFNRVILPTSHGSAYHNGTISTTVNACIWDARTFRIIIHNLGVAMRAWGSGWYPVDGDVTVMLNLRYQGL